MSASHDNTVKLWNAATGNLIETLRGHDSWVRSCAFSPDGLWALSGSYDRSVRRWDIGGYEELRVLKGKILRGHNDAILSARFSSDAENVVTASRDRTAKTWDIVTGQELMSYAEGHAYLASSAI